MGLQCIRCHITSKSSFKLYAVLGIIFIVIGASHSNSVVKSGRSIPTYIITETGKYSSLDPLDGDITSNLPVVRMVYSTPLFVNQDDTLSSHVLKEYKYDPETYTLTFVLMDGLKYSDGTRIDPEDVAFSIARMAFTRPEFPVIKDIVGLTEWLASPNSLANLPSGISVDGLTIQVRFVRAQSNPFYRFALELFAIIPRSCVDIRENKIICDEIPQSGPYVIESESDKEILFKARLDKQKPKTIRFKYVASEKIEKLADANFSFVGASNENLFSYNELQKISDRFNIKRQPTARFAVLLFNPLKAPFDKKECRQFFADLFRNEFHHLFGGPNTIEGSIFTKIVPGYLPYKTLREKYYRVNEKDCVVAYQKHPIKFGGYKYSTWAMVESTLLKIHESLGLPPPQIVTYEDPYEYIQAFLKGDVQISAGSSGFWALDPVGDLKMYFTPNLHERLNLVSRDPKLRKMIDGIDTAKDIKVHLQKITTHLYENAIFNVYGHSARFYFGSKKQKLNDMPIGITAPAPWQFFQ